MKLLANIRKNHFAVDMLSVVNSDIAAVILNIVASIMIARMLGPEKRGIVATILAVPFMVFPLAEMGMRQTAAYYIGKKIADERHVFATLGMLLIVLSAFGIVITLAIGALDGLPARYGWMGLLLGSIFIPFNLFFTVVKGVLIGKRGLVTIAVSTLLIPAAYFVLLFALIFAGEYQVEAAILATVVSTAVGAVFIGRQFLQYGTLKPAYIPGLPGKMLKLGLIYALTFFAINLNYRLDVLILERLSNVSEVGFYSVAVRLAESLWMVPNALALVNFSYSASAQHAQSQSLRTAKTMRVVLWGAILPGIGLYLLAPWLIPLFYGADFLRAGAAVQAILPGIWCALVFKMLNSDLAGRGLPWISLVVYGIGIPINIFFCIAWIPGYGSVGAGWASSLSYSAVAVMMAILYARVTQISIAELLLPRKSDFDFIAALFKGRRVS